MVETGYDSSLMTLLFVLAILIFAGLGWCFLSSCMGTPLLRSLSDLWNLMVLSGSVTDTASSRRRRALGEDNIWEMTDYRRGP
ncbi:uncharacterized protein HD556DRAFT_457086 [Suillus plorans]|uniref:Uncharacterized protein n=1 Tax=Suillus plorans TaxID=116603 RepID=A0A9P7DHQ0_9AGAM|nr:uncharacterized protein HD556DRAFT_457086 [Suillus plorans]KAG1793948.1 hypothetical protein HD556DRAFT_457086 [Suillus plorans]